MKGKKIVLALLVGALLVGCVYAASVNDFKVDSSYSNKAFSSDYYSVYANANSDSGVAIYKNVNDDAYDNLNDDSVENLVHGDGHEYLVSDDEMQVTKNQDNTATFTDRDQAEHGVVEMVQKDNEQFIVVFWAKDTNKDDLSSKLAAFNKDNNVTPVAF